ncbi:MAG: hypothetical protein U0235_17390 [Polyangiaceae bacterium]
MRALAPLLTSSALFTGCMFFRSLSELDEGRPDAATLAGDGGAESAVADAESDAAADVDAAPQPFGASLGRTPILCDDFDDSVTLRARWERPTGGGAVSLDPTFGRSPPRSVLATLNVPAGNCTFAALADRYPVSTRHARLGFALRVEASDLPDPPQNVPVAALSIGSIGGEDACQAVIVADQRGYFFLVQTSNASVFGNEVDGDGGAPFKPGEWTRLELDEDFVANKVGFFVDGQLRVSLPYTCTHAPGAVSFTAGYSCAHDSPMRELHLDDLTLDVD